LQIYHYSCILNGRKTKEISALYRAPRGTQDILPEEQPYWRFVQEQAAGTCQLYGYERIDLPVFEATGLFTRSIGDVTDIVEKEMYTFEDKGGESITLKPEGTAPVCRAYLQNGLHNRPQPVKLYYISPIFRYERPQAGRFRQHHQFGCEAIGEQSPALDAEMIEMAWRLISSLGLTGLKLQLNSIGCRQCRPDYIAKLKEYYTSRQDDLCSDCRRRLQTNTLRLLDCKVPECQPTAEAAPTCVDHLCPECREHFEAVRKYLTLLGLPFEMNHRLVRGLDYYTKTVFEIQPEQEGGQSTICAGGRYDDLIEELGGKATPAIGFGTGLERIILNLKKQEIPSPEPDRPAVSIAWLGEAAGEAAVKLAAELRQSGTGVTVTLAPRSLKAQLRQANNMGVKYTVIIGEEEVSTGTANVRDMATAEQKTAPIKQLPQLLA
jgi:histidyl-tRNA synthetase